jgi:hypothetical protein
MARSRSRRRATRLFSSDHAVYLSMAMRNYEEMVPSHPDPRNAWLHQERGANAINHMLCALEAHINDVRLWHGGANETLKAIHEWQRKSLVDRLEALLTTPRFPRRLRALLTEVWEFRNSLIHPAPRVELETKTILREWRDADGTGGHVASNLNRRPLINRQRYPIVQHKLPRGYVRTRLPGGILDVRIGHVRLCLLVAPHCAVLLDRYYQRWPEWPFYTVLGNGVSKTAVGWFEEIRTVYRGRLARNFRQVGTIRATRRSLPRRKG